jgi:hypothetical protein
MSRWNAENSNPTQSTHFLDEFRAGKTIFRALGQSLHARHILPGANSLLKKAAD